MRASERRCTVHGARAAARSPLPAAAGRRVHVNSKPVRRCEQRTRVVDTGMMCAAAGVGGRSITVLRDWARREGGARRSPPARPSIRRRLAPKRGKMRNGREEEKEVGRDF